MKFVAGYWLLLYDRVPIVVEICIISGRSTEFVERAHK